MKIFSSFDTNHKQRVINQYIQTHGGTDILVLERSRLFAWTHVYLPAFIYTVVFVAALYFIFTLTKGPNSRLYLTIGSALVFLFFMLPLLKKYIDYKMDFTVVTPTGVFLYNQRGIFYRTMSALNLQNIRTVNIQKSNLLYTIFDNGDIIFLSEGGEGDEARGDLGHARIYFVADPEAKKNKIQQIFEKSRTMSDE